MMCAPPSGPGLLTFGEAMGLVTATGIGSLDYVRDFTFGIGGAESNVAIGAARLGARVTWVGRVGRDAAGDLIERRLRAENLNAVVLRDDSFTGLMVRHHRTAGAACVDYHRAGSAAARLTPADVPGELIAQAAIVHVTGITPALGDAARQTVRYAVACARSAGVTVSLDVNYRGRLWGRDAARRELRRLVAQADIVFAGVEEARLVLDTDTAGPEPLARELAGAGPTEVIIKTGARGATSIVDGTVRQRPAPVVPVVDPVGAGDAFVAGYLAERLAGAGPARRLTTACAMGAYAVTVPGDCELLPTRAELAALSATEDVVR